MGKRISITLAVVATVVTLGAATPAEARDSGWNGTLWNGTTLTNR